MPSDGGGCDCVAVTAAVTLGSRDCFRVSDLGIARHCGQACEVRGISI